MRSRSPSTPRRGASDCECIKSVDFPWIIYLIGKHSKMNGGDVDVLLIHTGQLGDRTGDKGKRGEEHFLSHRVVGFQIMKFSSKKHLTKQIMPKCVFPLQCGPYLIKRSSYGGLKSILPSTTSTGYRGLKIRRIYYLSCPSCSRAASLQFLKGNVL